MSVLYKHGGRDVRGNNVTRGTKHADGGLGSEPSAGCYVEHPLATREPGRTQKGGSDPARHLPDIPVVPGRSDLAEVEFGHLPSPRCYAPVRKGCGRGSGTVNVGTLPPRSGSR